MTYERPPHARRPPSLLRHLVPLAALALLGPAACGDTSQMQALPPPPQPSGGDGTSCAQAVDITAVVAGGGTYSGRATAEGDFQGLCASQKGRIEYLRFDAAPGNYEISVSGPKGTAASTAVLDVLTDCTSSASELGCNPHATSPPTLVGVNKPGGVVLVLSGDWYGEGYELQIKPKPPCAHVGDCGGYWPQVLCATKSGVCYAPLDCAPGTADCDADPSNGCEADLTKDTANCGACGVSCAVPNVKSGTCVDSSCAIVCDPGYADCDDDTATGCETYIAGDGGNCGACGSGCPMHGGCAASTCTAPPDVLGTSAGYQLGPIALDAANVYLAGDVSPNVGGVVSVPKSGGAATLFAQETCFTRSILVDAGTVYWATDPCNGVDAAIKSKPAAGGGPPKVIASDASHTPAGLVADATTLYWFDAVDATIHSVPKAGGKPKLVASPLNQYMEVLALVADATTLYFTSLDNLKNTRALYSVPKSGGAPKMLAALPAFSGQLAISGTDLYVSTNTSISRMATSGGPLTPFTSANLGPSAPSAPVFIFSLAIAGGNLYWSEGAHAPDAPGPNCLTPGGIWRIPLAGGGAVGLASDEPAGPIAVDASGVYMGATCSGAVALRAGP